MWRQLNIINEEKKAQISENLPIKPASANNHNNNKSHDVQTIHDQPYGSFASLNSV